MAAPGISGFYPYAMYAALYTTRVHDLHLT
jgi:hypothetical protein